jgi:hypothetical protein
MLERWGTLGGSHSKTMIFFLILGLLFLAGAIYNLFKGDYREMAGGFFISAAFFAIYFSRRRKAAENATTIAAIGSHPSRCCKCGSGTNVTHRAYLVTYSLILYTSKSPGTFRPICERCQIRAGLPYSFATCLVGWWGIPWGPIYTVQAIYQNCKGGVVVSSDDDAA